MIGAVTSYWPSFLQLLKDGFITQFESSGYVVSNSTCTKEDGSVASWANHLQHSSPPFRPFEDDLKGSVDIMRFRNTNWSEWRQQQKLQDELHDTVDFLKSFAEKEDAEHVEPERTPETHVGSVLKSSVRKIERMQSKINVLVEAVYKAKDLLLLNQRQIQEELEIAQTREQK